MRATRRTPGKDSPVIPSRSWQGSTSLVKGSASASTNKLRAEEIDDGSGLVDRLRPAPVSSAFNLQTVGSRGSGSLRVGRNLPPSSIPSGSYTMHTPSSYVQSRLHTVNDERVHDLIHTIEKDKGPTATLDSTTASTSIRKKARAVTINLGGGKPGSR